MDSYRGQSVEIGEGFSVQFLFTGAKLHCEWSPQMPRGRKGKRLLPAYRAARDQFIRDLAGHHNINIAVLEA